MIPNSSKYPPRPSVPNGGDEVLVEGGVEHDVGEAEDEQVLDHLLSEVVVDTEDLYGKRLLVGGKEKSEGKQENAPPPPSTPSSSQSASLATTPSPSRTASQR
jgi:hypothetical protein